MENFIYEYPTKVFFGKGIAKEQLSNALKPYGSKIMLAYGGGSIKNNGIYNEITDILKKDGKEVIDFSGIMSNPTYAKVQEGAALAKEKNVDFILAVGGGSVIDCCKIISVQAKTSEDIWDMEFVQGKFPTEGIPVGAVVTASGTGAEMNSGAVITNEDLKIKAGVFGVAPCFAVLDPEYTMSVPKSQVISGAFDTLSHAMETYFGQSDKDNASDDIAEAVMKNTIRNMRTLLTDINDYTARSNLMWDSAMAENGILKLGRKTAFQAHQIEHQLGAYTDCNHGQGLAVLHPIYYKHIYKDGLSKFARFAVNVWGVPADGKSDEELAIAGIDALADFIKECGLPTHLTELKTKAKITEDMLKEVADSTNIIQTGYGVLTHEEIYSILKECI